MAHPVPRPLPQLGGFSSPSTELCDHTLRLREHLESAERLMQSELVHSPSEHLPPSIWDVKLYATAVTLLAAAAVEAALNAYGLMRFGTEQFERHFAFDGPVKRLRQLLKYARGLTLEEDDPLVQAVTRLSKRRNSLVHPRAYESTVDDRGTFQTPDAAWQAPTKTTDADQSISDMEQFFARFPALDPETATFLRPWPIRRR